MPETPSPRRRPIVILLVDDQQFVATVVTRLLATETDIDVHWCSRAADVIPLASEIRPTVVLQDLVMPGADGFSIIRQLRANHTTARTPVIVLSANDDAALRARATAEGAADYLVKLPQKSDLLVAIRRHSRGASGGAGSDPA